MTKIKLTIEYVGTDFCGWQSQTNGNSVQDAVEHALGKYFKAGENVTVREIAKRVPSVDSRATYIKVLARGVLDKALNIEADGFSSAAVNKISLAGGKVIRTKS